MKPITALTESEYRVRLAAFRLYLEEKSVPDGNIDIALSAVELFRRFVWDDHVVGVSQIGGSR